jgi:hypothetical protein
LSRREPVRPSGPQSLQGSCHAPTCPEAGSERPKPRSAHNRLQVSEGRDTHSLRALGAGR